MKDSAVDNKSDVFALYKSATQEWFISFLPPKSLLQCVGAPDSPLQGPLKGPLCLLSPNCQRNIIPPFFFPSLVSFWQGSPAPARVLTVCKWVSARSKARLNRFLSLTGHINDSPHAAWMARVESFPEVKYGLTQPLIAKRKPSLPKCCVLIKNTQLHVTIG